MATQQAFDLPTIRAFAVRAFTVASDGSVEVQYADGVPPLQSGADGAITWPTMRALKDEIESQVAQYTPLQLTLLYLAIVWLKKDGTYKAQSNIVGHELTFEPSAVQPIKVV